MQSGARSKNTNIQMKFDNLLFEISKNPEKDYSSFINLLISQINFIKMKSLSLALFVSSRNYQQIDLRESNKLAIFSTMQVILQQCPCIQTLDFINPTPPPATQSIQLADFLDRIAEDNGLNKSDPVLYFNEWMSEFIDFVTTKTRVNAILHAVFPVFQPVPAALKNIVLTIADKTKKAIGDQQMTGTIISRFKLSQDEKQLILSFLGDTSLFERYLINGANYDKLKMGMPKASLYKTSDFLKKPNYILNQLEASVRAMNKPPVEFQKLEGTEEIDYSDMPELKDDSMPTVKEVKTGSLLDMDLTLKK